MEHIGHQRSPREESTPADDHCADHAHEETQPDSTRETSEEDPPTAA
ncbi:hypothetical protein [Streptosporangium lutulentum]|uniref:Uncharacterized protein n=1 Tax=Streptosporangium lutulentum TaxID=1461250 RepID=A0ABT9QAV5_9ACTN|nr:hypothetical protein [Streptosporangium lutulentum]MDP9843069.1 hypothetical protein [Streptosporangium lutulentum]